MLVKSLRVVKNVLENVLAKSAKERKEKKRKCISKEAQNEMTNCAAAKNDGSFFCNCDKQDVMRMTNAVSM
jgi:hypothetical protein